MSDQTVKKTTLRDTVDTSFYQFDPEIGFWGKPMMVQDVSFEQRRGEYIRVSHNEGGNRDEPISDGRDKADLVCIGGSHTWGAGVEQELRYSNLLEQRIGKRVANLGHCSLGLDQVCLTLLQRVERYSPKAVIVEQYPWALHRVLNTYVNGYVKPQFYLDKSGKLQLRKVPRPAWYPATRRVIGSFHSYRKELTEHLAGINLKSGYDAKADPIFLLWKLPYYQHMYSLVDKILGVMRDFCKQRDIKLLFAVGAIAQQFGPPSSSRLISYDLPRKTFIGLLEKRRIEYVDMVQPMLEAHTATQPLIFADGHLNEKGNSVFADVVLARIEQNGLLA